jgi:hypothetical protein
MGPARAGKASDARQREPLTQIARASAREYMLRMMVGNMPAGVGPAERADRLAECESLIRKSEAAADSTIRQAYSVLAQEMLTAPPRDQLERQASAYIAKAAGAPDAGMAADLRRRADGLRDLCAPRRDRFDPAAIIRKAKADVQMLACWDQAGQLYGICDPDDIEMLDSGGTGQAPAGQAPPAGQAAPGAGPAAQVAKSRKSGKQMRAVFDQQQRLIGMIDPDKVTPVLDGVPGGNETIVKAHARFVAKAQRARVTKTAPAGHVPAYNKDGQHIGYVKPEDIASPEEQARNTGPVNLGGTTAMGRTTGPGENLPPLPGAVPGRQVVKAQQAPARPAPGRVPLLRDLLPRNQRKV